MAWVSRRFSFDNYNDIGKQPCLGATSADNVGQARADQSGAINDRRDIGERRLEKKDKRRRPRTGTGTLGSAEVGGAWAAAALAK